MVVSRAPSVVARRDLFALLSEATGVTVISAPAGSGKTVLLRSWIEEADLRDRVAWVAVDSEERDAQRFWLSVVGELRSAIGVDAFLERLEPTPAFEGGAVVERVISELGSLDQAVVLVIDDLHELLSQDALEQLESLLARRPPFLRVVLTSRREVRLGLHRQRLAGELTEIRSADLRFTAEEARQLLAGAGVRLPEESLALLLERTEGWVAGLRLAALALAGHPAPERFVAEFSGSERTVADYLVAEVLERQSEEARRLLLHTSILERVSGELADTLVGSAGSERLLQALEEQNAFVVSLDAARTWFRYHSLFADLLRLELRRAEPEAIPELHRRAAAWWETHGFVVEAIRHAQAAEEWPTAARLVAVHSFALYLDGRGATTAALLADFPAAGAAGDPELARVFASGAVWRGSLADADAYLALAERNAAEVPVERRPRFDVMLALTRLQLARRRGDFDAAREAAQPLIAAESPPAGEVGLDDDARASALLHLGTVEIASGRLAEAERLLEQGVELARLGGRPYLEVQCLGHLALAAGRQSLTRARERALKALALAEANGWGGDRVAAPAVVALGTVDTWQGRFDDAEEWLARAEQLVLPLLEPATGLLLYLAKGRLDIARGRYGEAAEAFREGARLGETLAAKQLLRVPALRLLTQALIQLGERDAAASTLAELEELAPESDMTRLALASSRLSSSEPQAALELLAPVLDGSVPSFPLFLVEAFLLDAAAHDQRHDAAAAEASVERALELAEPDALIWPFVVTPARAAVDRHAPHRTAHGAFLHEIRDVAGGSAPSARPVESEPLREDLSEGELRVLRYLPSNLSTADIARELYLSAHTVKTHMKHIYAKLDVHRRTEAVERARALGLLAPSTRLR